jgi:hypothetical protein
MTTLASAETTYADARAAWERLLGRKDDLLDGAALSRQWIVRGNPAG